MSSSSTSEEEYQLTSDDDNEETKQQTHPKAPPSKKRELENDVTTGSDKPTMKKIKRPNQNDERDDDDHDDGLNNDNGDDDDDGKGSLENDDPKDDTPRKIIVDEEARQRFENRRDLILKDLPQEYKDRFGQIYYVKFGSYYGPVLVLRPFQIEPGPLRDQWQEYVSEYEKDDSMEDLKFLIYWYGQFDNTAYAYSFLPETSFHDSEKHKATYEKKLKPLKTKFEAKKKGKEPILVKADREMKEDELKSPSERRGFLPPFCEDFEQFEGEAGSLSTNDHDDSDDEDDDSDDEPTAKTKSKVRTKTIKNKDTKSGPKKKSSTGSSAKNVKQKKKVTETIPRKEKVAKGKTAKKNGKGVKRGSDGQHNDDEDDDEDNRPKKKSKTVNGKDGNRSNDREYWSLYGSGDEEENDESALYGDSKPHDKDSPTPEQPEKLSAYDEYMLYGGGGDVSSHDEADEDYGESSDNDNFSDENNDDEDSGANQSSAKKKKKSTSTNNKKVKKLKKASKREQKKASVTSRVKNTTKKSSDAKKKQVPSSSTLKKHEQEQFEFCEDTYLPFIEKWKIVISEGDSEKLSIIYKKLLKRVDKFSAPFIETYELSAMMKQSKAILNNEQRKELISLFKEIYQTKKEKVPKGFKPMKKAEREEEQNSRKKQKTDSSDNAKVALTSKSTLAPMNGEKSRSSDNPFAPLKKKQTTQELKPDESKASNDRSEGKPDRTAEMKIDSTEKLKKKKFSLGMFMKPASSDNLEMVGTGSDQTKKETGPSPTTKIKDDLPPWTARFDSSDHSTKGIADVDELRELGLAFLSQAVAYIPPGKNVNHDAISRALESATFEITFDGTTRDTSVARATPVEPPSDQWMNVYWEKIHGITAALSGKGDREGLLARMIAKGHFNSPQGVLKLSDGKLLEYS